ANKVKTQAELYPDATRVFVFVPNDDFESIKSALCLSETAASINEFVKLIRLLDRVKWFSSQWTLQEMFLSYERMMVLSPGGKSIPCGWLVDLKIRLAALLEKHWMCLKEDDLAALNALAILQLGIYDPGRMVTALLMRCRGNLVRYSRVKPKMLGALDAIRDGLISDVPGGLPARAQLMRLAVNQHDVSWLAFQAKPASGEVILPTMPVYGATWPAAGQWQTVCDLRPTGAGLLWFGATGTVRLPEADEPWFWFDHDVPPERRTQVTYRVIVLCVKHARARSEHWLGLLVSRNSGRAERLGGCVLLSAQVQLFESGAVLIV
ncbi:hypothetical protein BGZ58_005038, partial [Dissophora ornata]